MHLLHLPKNPYPARELRGVVWRMFGGAEPPPAPGTLDVHWRASGTLGPLLRIGLVGDIMPLMWRTATFDPAVLEFLAECDAVVGNFEGIITNKSWLPFLQKHTPPILDLLTALVPANRWWLNVANNHAPDYGDDAFAATVQELGRRGFHTFGTSAQPSAWITPRISVTGWTEWLNGSSDKVAQADPGAPAEAGFHIAFPHWGYEFERTPRRDQRQRCPLGYNLVAGHHSHLPQPVEQLTELTCWAAWSLGNFLTEVKLKTMGEGMLVRIGLEKDIGLAPALLELEAREISLDRRDSKFCKVAFRAAV